MAVRPIVDGIELEHEDELKVIRINVLDPQFQPILETYEFRLTPTFIFFDSQGRERWRTVGAVDPLQVTQTLSELP
jgi:thioredoxin-related protein